MAEAIWVGGPEDGKVIALPEEVIKEGFLVVRTFSLGQSAIEAAATDRVPTLDRVVPIRKRRINYTSSAPYALHYHGV